MLLSTPLRPAEIVLGKMSAYFLLGAVDALLEQITVGQPADDHGVVAQQRLVNQQGMVESAKQAAGEMADQAEGMASDMGDAMNEAADDSMDAMGDAMDAAGDEMEDAMDSAEDKMKDMAN